jgi:hypothetical protein
MATAPDISKTLNATYTIDFTRPLGSNGHGNGNGHSKANGNGHSNGNGNGNGKATAQTHANAPVTGLGGVAYPATGRQPGRGDLIAIVVPPGLPPRAEALASETAVDLPGVMMPVEHGRIALPGGQYGYAVITAAPPGPAFALPARPLSETDLLDLVLKPAAQTLAKLHARRVTHRNIRPDNLFLAGNPAGVVLGPAWIAPPGSLQPPAYDPPYSAMCLPAGRGDGVPADDIYALGAVMLALAVGRAPLAGLDADAVVRRKLTLGSYAALLEDDRLPPAVGDLVRAMLADDPDHRPSAALLMDPVTARGRRVTARPTRRATRELMVGAESVLDARGLAYAMAREPGPAAALLRAGAADEWLRRDLGDAALAQQVDEVLRAHGGNGRPDSRPDAQLVAAVVPVLDRLAPLCWDGVAWWPDAAGPALATASPADADRIEHALVQDAATTWWIARAGRTENQALTAMARLARSLLAMPGPAGGRRRVLYTLNPLLACASPGLANACVCRLEDVLPALEVLAATAEARRALPIDLELGAFLASRADPQRTGGVAAMIERPPANVDPVLFQLRVLSMLQTKLLAGPLPQLGTWMQEQAIPLLDGWNNKAARAALEARLRQLAKAGQLGPMLAAIEDPAAQAADAQGAEQARAEIGAIDAMLQAVADGVAARAEYAQRLGQELAVGAGMTALAGALVALALG